MLSRLFVRLITPFVVYGSISFGIWNLRTTIPTTFSYGILGLIALYVFQLTYTAIKYEWKLDRLGKRAPLVTDYSPWGLYLIYRVIRDLTRHKTHDFWWENFSKYGNSKNPYTVEAINLGERIIFTADEENIKAVLATQFHEFGKGEQFRKEWKEFLGLSIFTTDGDMWHNSRSLLRPQFIKTRVSDLHKFESHTQELLPLLSGQGATVQIDEMFYRFALDAATDFLLGTSVDSLRKGQTEFAEAFGEVQAVQSVIARAGPINALVPRKKFRASLRILNSFVNQYIDQALRLPQDELEKMTKSDEGYTFLHALASYTRDREVLRDQIVAVLLAGRDTTAVTLSWTFYELSKRPAVVKRLREEIISVVGLERCPTYDDLKSMRYLQHILNETLRLYPVVPYNVRVALQDTTLPHGGGPHGNEPIGVIKDTPFGYSAFILHRRPEIYPDPSTGFPDYLDYVPERWENWTPKPWTYIPFNGGPRICIGQQFALTEMSYVITRIFQTFTRVESRQDDFPGFRSDIVLQPAQGVKVAFFKDE